MRGILLFLMCALAGAPAVAAEVEFKTNKGTMVFFIDEENAPQTAENFLSYVRQGFFNGLIFHRVIPGFVIQGGGFEPGMKQRQTNPPIPNEADNGLKNLKHTLSMARTQDPHSATSQFFINLRDNPNLDRNAGSAGYAVFGKVVKGGDEVIGAILQVPTGNVGPFQNVPREDIVVEQARIL